MPKTKRVDTIFYKFRALIIVLAVAGLIGGATVVHADQFDAQIKALQAQNANTQGVLNGLESQAGSYQDAISQLQAQINAVQSQIAANQANQAQLQQQIVTDQQQIDLKKQQLGATLKAMYIDGQVTTIEELATSKNLSDYVDKEEYRTNVQNQLNTAISQIAALQAELQKEKAQIDQLLTSEKAQNDQLASAQAQQAQLLSYNQGQQDAYNQQIASNSSQITALRKAQIAANARFIGSGAPGSGPTCGGGYPAQWCQIPQDSVIDSWGMYNRECVSYTAFKVHQDYLSGRDGHDMPWWGGSGNANQWPGDARASGIPVDSNPTPGSIAISTGGAFGHAMYVESVNGDGSINVSQYNASLDGRFSTRSGLSPSGLYFLHF